MQFSSYMKTVPHNVWFSTYEETIRRNFLCPSSG